LLVETRRGWPVSLEWKGRREIVLDIIDFWVVEGSWWREPRRRLYFRIQTDHRMHVIHRSGSVWKTNACRRSD
jgi:hypothetical protein